MAKVTTITRGPIYSTIFKLAWPIIASMVLETALSIIDYFWVGYLGTPEQDAVTSSTVVSWTLFSTIAIVVTGLTAMVSRAVGSEDLKRAEFVSKQGIQMAVGVGLALAIAGYFLAPLILEFLKTSDQVFVLAVPYLRIFFVSMIFHLIAESLGAIFRADGDTTSPTIAFASAAVINMVLDPFLIFGWGPFPELGVTGAAIASMISIASAVTILIGMLLRGKLEFSVAGWYRNRPDFLTISRIGRIGLPIYLQNITFTTVYWFLIQIVHDFGETAGAAMGIGNRLESLSYMTAFGFSMAASTMVGQNLGAKNPDRASQCAWGSILIISIETFIISILFLTLPKQIANIFSDDPGAIAIATDYLIILGLSQVFMGIEIVLEGAFSGAGDTIPPMSVSIPGSLLRLPIAWYMAYELDFGVNGVWWSLTITSFLKAVVMMVWFKRGNWKKKVL